MSTTVDGLTQATVSVTSTTVPVSLMPPVFKYGGWILQNRSSSTQAVLVFVYIGTLPNSAPADVWEVLPGSTLNDALASAMSGADGGFGLGLAAVMEVAGTATVDVMYR